MTLSQNATETWYYRRLRVGNFICKVKRFTDLEIEERAPLSSPPSSSPRLAQAAVFTLPRKMRLLVVAPTLFVSFTNAFTLRKLAVTRHTNHLHAKNKFKSPIDEYRLVPEPDDGLGPFDFGITDSLFVPEEGLHFCNLYSIQEMEWHCYY
jgi:hypothetical protein